MVFGFHPYWNGSSYLNYQWNLLSDLCYFSYEVDPSTGDPVTYYDWLTDPVIDSAQANGVRVHLCATIFSGHAAFFTNLSARQNLISQLIALVQQRNADGVNMDIEAMPSSVSDSVSAFMKDLSNQLKAAVPGAKVSIDLPGVDWNDDFQVALMSDYVDWFFVMAYDYYWSGSGFAGPVSPLYSMVSDYNYSLSRTVSAYEKAGMEPGKFILGIPYYGRRWKTQSDAIPSPTTGGSSAVTYSNVRTNSSVYSTANYTWEPNSSSSAYIFFQNDSWNQCFIGLERDLRKKYDIVNYRDLAGIGIWALGYDNGYPDLWQAISDKFSDCFIPLNYDTIYDSGGPTWNYYGDEDYTMTINHGFNDLRYLTFTDLNLESTFDSLWLYAGPDTTFPFLGGFSGETGPGTVSSQNGAFTLKFKSDEIYNFSGWKAVFHNGSLGEEENCFNKINNISIFPNPSKDWITISFPDGFDYRTIIFYDYSGRKMEEEKLRESNNQSIEFNVMNWPAGIYSMVLIDNQGNRVAVKFVKN